MGFFSEQEHSGSFYENLVQEPTGESQADMAHVNAEIIVGYLRSSGTHTHEEIKEIHNSITNNSPLWPPERIEDLLYRIKEENTKNLSQRRSQVMGQGINPQMTR